MCWFREFSDLISLPICLPAALDHTAEVPIDLLFGLALTLLLLLEIVEGVVDARMAFVLVS